MFKAKLIDSKEYYKLRSKHLWLSLLPTIPIAFLTDFYMFSTWITALIVVCYILIIAFISKNQRLMSSMIGQNIIEIDATEIRIKTNKGNHQETIILENLDQIVLQSEYGLPQDTIKDIANEASGRPKKNNLIIRQKNEKRKFDFEIDSHYMINQLNKVIHSWTQNGLKIKRI